MFKVARKIMLLKNTQFEHTVGAYFSLNSTNFVVLITVFAKITISKMVSSKNLDFRLQNCKR